MSAAASLPPAARQTLAIEVLSKTQPISHLAAQHQVSRKFLYQQGQKANEALEATFSSATDEPEVLFYLPITKTWLWQLILALILICHCSYPWCCGTVEGFVRPTNERGDDSQSAQLSC
jgi:hypothetical protein